jgi:hypothetical protein
MEFVVMYCWLACWLKRTIIIDLGYYASWTRVG